MVTRVAMSLSFTGFDKMMKGKHIVVGVTGGIAAYKSAFLVRLLVKAGAHVRVIMTRSAHDFITPLTLSTLSKNPVLSDFSASNGEWNNHVELGKSADMIVVAPASANTMAKMARGECDNLLLAVYLSATCPVAVAPAMDLDMFAHPVTQKNLEMLRESHVNIIPPGTGELASGLFGEGRMAEPEAIFEFIRATFAVRQRLKGKKILVTAGPTFEAIDPVRYIGNHSTGKMGFALAEALADRGAEVLLVAGPVSLSMHHPGVKRKNVTTAKQMYDVCMKNWPSCDAAVLAAAVADFRPKKSAEKKIKKGKGGLKKIELEETSDILASLGKIKTKKQVLGGFALETDHETENALSKLERKNADFIVLNSLNEKGAGFGTDTNRITLFSRGGKTRNFELKPKKEVAADIAEHLAKYFKS